MNQEELAELAKLQSVPWATLSTSSLARLEELRTKLAKTETERADDPNTLRDETERPNLSDDKDFGKEQLKRDVQETVRDVKEAVGFFAWLLSLFRGFRR